MPGRKAKPPRLYARRQRDGARVWIILDRGRQIRTGCGFEDTDGAAQALRDYIGARHRPTLGARDPAALALADVITAYGEAKRPKGADPNRLRRYDEMIARLETLNAFFGDKTLADLKGRLCRDYVAWRMAQPWRHARSAAARAKTVSAASPRRELEDLRAAINAYHAEHTLTFLPVVTLPERSRPRERWLTRQEAARLLGAALGFVWDRAGGPAADGGWKRERGRLMRRDRLTRTRRRHIARFILVGLYSARREQAIRRTQWIANTEGGWFDLARGIYHGRGRGERETKKRRPPAKIAHRLQPHLARWRRLDEALGESLGHAVRHVIHRPDGRPLEDKIKTGWAGVLADAGLDGDVVRHTLRHTAATWLMQAGADLWTAAGWLGMTVEMLEENYGHHHPDFQDEAASAFSGARRG